MPDHEVLYDSSSAMTQQVYEHIRSEFDAMPPHAVLGGCAYAAAQCAIMMQLPREKFVEGLLAVFDDLQRQIITMLDASS